MSHFHTSTFRATNLFISSVIWMTCSFSQVSPSVPPFTQQGSWQFVFHSPLHIRPALSCDHLKPVVHMFVCNKIVMFWLHLFCCRKKPDSQTEVVPNNMGLNAACLTLGYLSVGTIFQNRAISHNTLKSVIFRKFSHLQQEQRLFCHQRAFKQSQWAVKVLMRNLISSRLCCSLQNLSSKFSSGFSTSITRHITQFFETSAASFAFNKKGTCVSSPWGMEDRYGRVWFVWRRWRHFWSGQAVFSIPLTELDSVCSVNAAHGPETQNLKSSEGHVL